MVCGIDELVLQCRAKSACCRFWHIRQQQEESGELLQKSGERQFDERNTKGRYLIADAKSADAHRLAVPLGCSIFHR
jgi:hypothetical protein